MTVPNSISPSDLPRYYQTCRELARFAEAFSQNARELCRPPFEPLFTLEARLASQARTARLAAGVLSVSFGSFPRDVFPRAFERSLDAFASRVDELLMRWGWTFVLADDGLEQVKSRLEEHERARRTPLLRQALAWRSMPSVEPHENADSLADEAEKRGLLPIDLGPESSPELAERRTWELHNEWTWSSALGKDRPRFEYEERNQLAELVDVLRAEANRVLSKVPPEHARPNPDAAPQAQEPSLTNVHPRLSRSQIVGVIAASRGFTQSCREWSDYEGRNPPTSLYTISRLLHAKAVRLNQAFVDCEVVDTSIDSDFFSPSASVYFGRMKAEFEDIVGNKMFASESITGRERFTWGLRSWTNPKTLIDLDRKTGSDDPGIFGDFRYRPFSFGYGVIESLGRLEESTDRFETACNDALRGLKARTGNVVNPPTDSPQTSDQHWNDDTDGRDGKTQAPHESPSDFSDRNLEPHHKRFLMALLDLGADRSTPSPIGTILSKAGISEGPDHRKTKTMIIRMKQNCGYIESKTGNKGGYFLTKAGLATANRLVRERNARGADGIDGVPTGNRP